MQYSKMLSLSFIFIFFSHVALEARLPFCRTDIDKKAVLIEKQLTRERYIMYCFTGLSIAHELAEWMNLFGGFLGQMFPGASDKGEKPDTPKEKMSKWQAFKQALSWLVHTKEGWVSMAQCGLSVGGYYMISKVGEALVHPDTLYWYINARAPYGRTITMMQEQLLALQDLSPDQTDMTEQNDFMWTLYNRLVRQGELICAYMAYKVKYLDDAEKAIGERAVNIMINSQKNWLERLAGHLKADNQQYEAIEKLLVAYRADISKQLNHFSVIEGETAYDRSVVKRRVKAA